jgi:hypothetical protein
MIQYLQSFALAHVGYLGQERDREQQLSDLERERLEDMLRSLRVERSDIRTAMLFVLDHASCAVEISEVLIASLTLEETPPHLKVSRCAEPPSYDASSSGLLGSRDSFKDDNRLVDNPVAWNSEPYFAGHGNANLVGSVMLAR